MPSIVRTAAVAACAAWLAFAGCGSKKPVATTPGGHVTKPVAGGGAGSGSAAHTGSGAVSVVPEVGCLAPSCAYHAGANGYFACLAGGAGACFHFGAPCSPADGCMYDASDRTYKQCSSIVEGTCKQWGAACAPATKCMFSPGDGLHHTCEDIAGGTCKRYGALCSP